MIAPLYVIARRAASTVHTIQATYDLGIAALGIPGDYVECGVFLGANAAALAKAACHPMLRNKRVHLFDSFEGVPQAGEYDLEWTHPVGISRATEFQVRQHMREWSIPAEVLVYHPGMFQDTVPVFSEHLRSTRQTISILRLDGDLYESTKVCLQHLYPLVTPGGWVIVDDYQLSGCRKAVDECIGPYPPIYFQRT